MSVITRWIWTLLPPLIIALGTFGNVMVLAILCRSQSPTSNVFFIAMSISDLFLLYTGLLRMWLREVFEIALDGFSSLSCKAIMFVTNATGVVTVWLLVAMTTQRAASIVWPHKVHVVCTRRLSLSLVAGVTVTALLLHAHMLYGYELKRFSNTSASVCTDTTDEYNIFMSIVWPWLDLLSFSLLPFLLLAISNGVLVWKLLTSVRNLKSVAASRNQFRLRQKEASSVTKTVFFVSIVFVLLSLPYSVSLIVAVSYIGGQRNYDLRFRDLLGPYYTVVTLLWFSNSAVNFYLYCLTGHKFRTEFKDMMCQCRNHVNRCLLSK